jgi:hypothetical protein
MSIVLLKESRGHYKVAAVGFVFQQQIYDA